MREEWKRFIAGLRLPVEFLHADELKERYGVEGVPLPVIFRKGDEGLETLVDAKSIDSCQSIAELKRLITDGLD
jgi:hypothetical protein